MDIRQTQAHLGGARAFYLTGAKDFVHDPKEREFSFRVNGRVNGKRVNRIVVGLVADLYTIRGEYVSFRNGNYSVKTIASEDGVYCEDLQDAFERVSGLVTRLGKVIYGVRNKA